jgi:hypothetical protein
MSECKCQPPCKCNAEDRGNICEKMLRVRNDDGTYKMVSNGYYRGHEKDSDNPKENWVHVLKQCGMKGTLQEGCNGFWESKRVLCETHIPEYKADADRLCGICRTPKRECCC